ncbi:hypothetical protein Zm00014a_043854 [Zea mays]|uniref:Uncharacterized protein n=1 Tax=Zea mays TaxID=4577 RepID=A0A3L6FVB0_MAIZE|nr:hypothetical protein Zm00014a_043854 [Zea mays]
MDTQLVYQRRYSKKSTNLGSDFSRQGMRTSLVASARLAGRQWQAARSWGTRRP